MPRVPYVFPPAGSDAVADAIRQRRGARGLTSLDGMLLNAPPIAQGWNTLLGAVRTGSQLEGDLREIMILRVAARNKAAFEWIQHEKVAREEGVSTEQLNRIGDLGVPALSSTRPGAGSLSSIQAAMLSLADEMTTKVQVSDETFEAARSAFQKAGEDETAANRKVVEAVATTAVYNMVSRFLVALDIDDKAAAPVPVPGMDNSSPLTTSDDTSYRYIDVKTGGGCRLASSVSFTSVNAPWIILVNSLMTNLTMWKWVLPHFQKAGYNVISYDQRGHGRSSVPGEACTMEILADDVAEILSAYGIDKAYAVIGVSQGGATALSFAVRHPQLAERVIACDTQASTPSANVQAWNDRIDLARRESMSHLADQTVPRWFGEQTNATLEVRDKLHELVSTTSVDGFEKGARALQSYDLLQAGLLEALAKTKALLIAGEHDGKLPETLRALAQQVREQDSSANVHFEAIPASGHLPMCDNPDKWWEVVGAWLAK
ncbi:alpha/beta-hydrolase [Ceraceosorus guamensis]|uniref:Alpha/beta-hydrolase n=1 Tax=Ceraceosorus guamensis TaxID=1522189 RepID=A0A316W6J7_9BASI|nr:alpha/beta-hydrolase [Ceraceosorus guamensis]PWN45517.1 alpha/beta-hydrolase [Ceraceosorus guamensis]